MERISYDYIKVFAFKKELKNMCLKERRKKLFYKERMFLRTFW